MTARPSSDEFDTWQGDPVTRWVLSGVRRFGDLQKASWAEKSWSAEAGQGADQTVLDRLRTRADAYEGLAGLTYEQACGLHEETHDA